MKNNLKSLAMLMLFAVLINSCGKDDEDNPSIDPQEDPVTTSVISSMVNDNEILDFTFDECGFENTQAQRMTNSFGTFNDHNTKSLTTRIYNRNETGEVSSELMLSAKFVSPMDEGPIDEIAIQQILDTEINSTYSEFFGLELGLRFNDAFYTNITTDYSADLSTRFYTYNPGFTYEITAYEVAIDSDCNEEKMLKVNGNFEGKLYHYAQGELNDSITIEINELELLLIID